MDVMVDLLEEAARLRSEAKISWLNLRFRPKSAEVSDISENLDLYSFIYITFLKTKV